MKAPKYQSKSTGYWIYALAGLFAMGGVVFFFASGTEGGSERFMGLFILLIGLILSNFATLTVRVTEHEVAWSFGLGWIGRRIKFERIRGAEAGRSPWYWGWGIRWTPRGWLWRSHGLDAVWLELKTGKQIGIGTQDPDGLVQAIRSQAPSVEALEPG